MVHMRHPNLLNFLGLCTLPPCLLTGRWGEGEVGAGEGSCGVLLWRAAVLHASLCIG